MKYLIGISFSVMLCANEIDRIETIVKDIETLRLGYTSCQEELNSSNKYKVLLNAELEKNNILKSKIENMNKENTEKVFEKQVKDLKNILKDKDIVINNLKNDINKLVKNKEKRNNSLVLKEKI